MCHLTQQYRDRASEWAQRESWGRETGGRIWQLAQLQLATRMESERREWGSGTDSSLVCSRLNLMQIYFTDIEQVGDRYGIMLKVLVHDNVRVKKKEWKVWMEPSNPLLISMQVNIPPANSYTGLRNANIVFDLLLWKHRRNLGKSWTAKASSCGLMPYIRLGKVNFPAITAMQEEKLEAF